MNFNSNNVIQNCRSILNDRALSLYNFAQRSNELPSSTWVACCVVPKYPISSPYGTTNIHVDTLCCEPSVANIPKLLNMNVAQMQPCINVQTGYVEYVATPSDDVIQKIKNTVLNKIRPLVPQQEIAILSCCLPSIIQQILCKSPWLTPNDVIEWLAADLLKEAKNYLKHGQLGSNDGDYKKHRDEPPDGKKDLFGDRRNDDTQDGFTQREEDIDRQGSPYQGRSPLGYSPSAADNEDGMDDADERSDSRIGRDGDDFSANDVGNGHGFDESDRRGSRSILSKKKDLKGGGKTRSKSYGRLHGRDDHLGKKSSRIMGQMDGENGYKNHIMRNSRTGGRTERQMSDEGRGSRRMPSDAAHKNKRNQHLLDDSDGSSEKNNRSLSYEDQSFGSRGIRDKRNTRKDQENNDEIAEFAKSEINNRDRKNGKDSRKPSESNSHQNLGRMTRRTSSDGGSLGKVSRSYMDLDSPTGDEDDGEPSDTSLKTGMPPTSRKSRMSRDSFNESKADHDRSRRRSRRDSPRSRSGGGSARIGYFGDKNGDAVKNVTKCLDFYDKVKVYFDEDMAAILLKCCLCFDNCGKK